jgi:hypothetical protein
MPTAVCRHRRRPMPIAAFSVLAPADYIKA